MMTLGLRYRTEVFPDGVSPQPLREAHEDVTAMWEEPKGVLTIRRTEHDVEKDPKPL